MTDTNYKNSELGQIPVVWKVLDFEEIAMKKGLIRGPFGGALKKEIFTSSGFKVYEQQNAIYKSVKLGSYYIDHRKYNELERFSVNENDFILSCSGTIGRLYRIPTHFEKGIINQALMLIRLNPQKIDYAFFENQFNSDIIQNKILVSQGGAMKNLVGMEQIRKVKFAIPPLPEQQAIANCLTTWDEAIKKQTQLIAFKQQRKKALMQQLLSGKKRLPGFSEEWKEYKLEELLLQFQNGYAFNAKDYKKNGIPIISMASIDLSGKFKRVNFNYWQEDENLKRYKVEKGDLLIAMTDVTPEKNLIGKMAIVDYDGPFYLNQRVGLLKINNKLANKTILSSLSLLKKWRDYTRSSATLGVQANLSTMDIQKGIFYLPNIEEQDAIAEILERADKEINLEKKKLTQLKLQKKGLMQQLLTGKVRLV